MYRYLLIGCIAISAFIVIGSYFLSNKLFAIDDIIEPTTPKTLEVQVPSGEQRFKILTDNKKTNKEKLPLRITDSFPTSEPEIAPDNLAISSEQDEFFLQQKDFSNNSTVSQKSSTQGEQNQASKNNESRERNYLTWEETQRAHQISAEIMNTAISPERRQELIDMYNELIRPVRGQNIRTIVIESYGVDEISSD